MHTAIQTSVSKSQLWAGRVVSGLVIALFLLDGVMKLVKPAVVVSSTVALGYPESEIVGIGVALLVSTAAYAIPRISVLGAVLLTGYLGGAIASKVRIDAPLFDICFALVFAALIWGGLILREPRLRALLPLRH